jgi:hypothetical protein
VLKHIGKPLEGAMGSLRKLDQGFPPLQTAARRDSLAGLGRGLCPWSAMQSRLERNGQGAMGRGLVYYRDLICSPTRLFLGGGS